LIEVAWNDGDHDEPQRVIFPKTIHWIVKRQKTSPPSPSMKFGDVVTAKIRVIVWCLPFGEPHGFTG
jgi:hypothetical protein